MMLSPLWVTSLLMQSCNSNEPSIKAFVGETANEEYLSQKIPQKDFYLIYGWTIWCGPCRNTIKEKLPKLQRYLDSTGFSVGVMAICADDRTSKAFFELHEFMDSASIESYFLETGRLSLHDRWAMNSYFAELLSEYQNSEAVPIVILVDQDGKVISPDPWLIASPKQLRQALELLPQ